MVFQNLFRTGNIHTAYCPGPSDPGEEQVHFPGSEVQVPHARQGHVSQVQPFEVVQLCKSDDLYAGDNHIGVVQDVVASHYARVESDNKWLPAVWRDECIAVEHNNILLAKGRIQIQPRVFLGAPVPDAREAIDQDGFQFIINAQGGGRM